MPMMFFFLSCRFQLQKMLKGKFFYVQTCHERSYLEQEFYVDMDSTNKRFLHHPVSSPACTPASASVRHTLVSDYLIRVEASAASQT